MKRFILNSIVFLLFSISAYIILVVISGLAAPAFLKKNLIYKKGTPAGHTYSRLKEVSSTKDINVLFLGSSHSYRGYDPRIFAAKNLKAFNMGSSAQTPLQTELLIDRYLDQLHPQTVVFDIYPAVFEMDGVESGIDLIVNGPIDFKTFQMVLKINSVKVYNTFIYSLFRQVFKLDKKYKEQKIKDGDTYVGNGYVETYKKYTPKKNINSRVYTLSPNQLNAFKRILVKLKQRNIPYVLVQAPMTVKKYNSFTNNDEMDSIISQYGQYYNFNKILSLPDSMFFDDSHLNQTGVNIFNKKLMEVINLLAKKNQVYNFVYPGDSSKLSFR
jgi:hypothetical protein